jgi:iron complex outermembrane receptor protein
VLKQQKLTSYEIGSKNTLLNNRLRLNGAMFYYDYEGYVEAVNTVTAGPPIFTPMAVPLEMFGVEMSGEYLLTMYDKVSFDIGYVSIEITDLPIFDGFDSADFIALTDQLPGNPDLTANLGYDHTFLFGNGSTLVPRVQLRYKSAHYLNQMTQAYVDLDLKPYNHQDAYVIGDVGVTWTSADDNYSVTGYVRNIFDEEYKAGVGLSTTVQSVTPGDPQAWGLMVTAKF